jgi:hypothetical protein
MIRYPSFRHPPCNNRQSAREFRFDRETFARAFGSATLIGH